MSLDANDATGYRVIMLKDSMEKNVRAHFWYQRRDRLPMWVVFGPATLDYPGHYVARLFVGLPVLRPTRRVLLHDTLAELRSMMPIDSFGLVCIPRVERDDPVILETWI